MALVKTAQYYFGALRAELLDPRRRRGREQDRRRRAAPRAQPAHGHLDRRRRPVRLEHLAARLGAADHRGRAVGVRVARDRHDRTRPCTSSSSSSPNELPEGEARTSSATSRATRDAFDLDQVEAEQFAYKRSKTGRSTRRDARRRPTRARSTTRACGTRPVIRDTYQMFQSLQTFYQFADADVDRYVIDGKTRQVLIAARELNSADLPEPDLGQPPPRVHARVRRGGVAEQRGDRPTASRTTC